MLNCAEQGQIQKYETHAYQTLKTAGVQIIMLKHPTKHKKGKKTKQPKKKKKKKTTTKQNKTKQKKNKKKKTNPATC